MPRRAHTCNVWRESLIIVGGGDGGHALSDIHRLDLTQDPPHWSTITTTGTPPPERGYHTTTLVKDKLVVYGGSDGKLCFSDIYLFDLGKKKNYTISFHFLTYWDSTCHYKLLWM